MTLSGFAIDWRRLALALVAVAALALATAAQVPTAGLAPRPAAVAAGPSASLAAPPMPLLGRAARVEASADNLGAARALDGDYGTTWRPGARRAWLAINLGALPPSWGGRATLAWYAETGVYDYAATGEIRPPVPTDYRIEASAAAGDRAPASGWVALATVRGNRLHSRQHAIDLAGYRWVRLNIVAAGSADLALNVDLHDATAGADDGWLICGSSSNAAAMDHARRGDGTFAEIIAAARPGRFPVQENGGMSGTTSADGARLLPGWLPQFPGRYVALSYGLNDANRAEPGQVDAEAFYRNYVAMVEAVLAAGKVPVVSTVPWARTVNAQVNTPLLNAQIARLYATYPRVVPGPDLYGYFVARPELISHDDLHPSEAGMAAWRRQWAERALDAIYVP